MQPVIHERILRVAVADVTVILFKNYYKIQVKSKVPYLVPSTFTIPHQNALTGF